MTKFEKTFYLEASLRGLAKWLRFVGLKVEITKNKITHRDILQHKDKFFLITSYETAKILDKYHIDYLIVPRDNLKTQLKFFFNYFNLTPKLSLDICSLCGEPLISVKKEDFKEKIPPKVWEKYNSYNYCPKCDKLYWEGDHVQRLKKKFKELLNTSL
ncbi:MAG: Mut7-C RNAse domain-containing protein [Caldimicrobium sp.]